MTQKLEYATEMLVEQFDALLKEASQYDEEVGSAEKRAEGCRSHAQRLRSNAGSISETLGKLGVDAPKAVTAMLIRRAEGWRY